MTFTQLVIASWPCRRSIRYFCLASSLIIDNDNLLYFATFSKDIPSFNNSRANSNFPSFLPSSRPFFHPSCLPFIRPSSYIPSPKLHMTAKSPSPSCVKSIPKSLCRVVIFSLAFFDESFIELGADGPPVAVRKPPRIQMPLSGNRFKLNTLPRVTLASWQRP